MGEKNNWAFLIGFFNGGDKRDSNNWFWAQALGISPYRFVPTSDSKTKSEELGDEATIQQIAYLIANVGKKHTFMARIPKGSKTDIINQAVKPSGDPDKILTWDTFLIAADLNKLPADSQSPFYWVLSNYDGGVILKDATISPQAIIGGAVEETEYYYLFEGKGTDFYVGGRRLWDIFLPGVM